MDDLFQYLIWGIIIFSFISSFFKKKEPPKQTPLPKAKQPDVVNYPKQQTDVERITVSQKQDEYDILRELENLFKGEIKTPTPQKQKQGDPYDIYESNEIKDKDLDLVVDKRMQRNVEDMKPIGSRETYDNKSAGRRSVSDRQAQQKIINPKIEEQAKEFERVLAGPKQQRATVTEFNRKLKNPRTVKEYILFSEILGKPKALRR
ncbi:MAG TPA: hypothetical protein VF870_10505 [Ignavibacteriaceae bacterium]